MSSPAPRGRATVESVNVGKARPSLGKSTRSTGIAKAPQQQPVEVRAPGPRRGGLGSGLVGDFIGDSRHHGGDDQAVYAFQREDLDQWADRLGRPLPAGSFGENLTTVGIDLNASRIGDRWRVGEQLELQVTSPRLPCVTFRTWMGETGWLRTFTDEGRPGAYLRVVHRGEVSAGDPIEVVHRPPHDVTIALVFRALTTEPALLTRVSAAYDSLPPELRATVDPPHHSTD